MVDSLQPLKSKTNFKFLSVMQGNGKNQKTLRTLVQTRMRTRLSAKGKKKMQRLKRLAAIFLLQYYAALIHANEVPMNVQKTPCSST